jgi:uncharacterized membrane protein
MSIKKDHEADKETARIEAFSDGVYAIAITLLVLEIHVPDRGSLRPADGLATALMHQWPSYLAFVISFLTILIMWVNHHRLFQHVHRRDHSLLILNGLVLLGVTFVPFPTALLAEYINTPNEKVAVIVFSGCYLVIAISYSLLWRHISAGNRLLHPDHDVTFVTGITRQYNAGLTAYFIAFAMSFVSPAASIALLLLLAIYFALPERVVLAHGRRPG